MHLCGMCMFLDRNCEIVYLFCHSCDSGNLKLFVVLIEFLIVNQV